VAGDLTRTSLAVARGWSRRRAAPAPATRALALESGAD